MDNLIPLRGRTNRHQYAGWTPTRLAESGLGCRLESDVGIEMQDGVRLSADVYTPKKPGRYPAIVQIAAYNKELSSTGMPKGTNEVGSPPILTDRGYVQVLASRRGMGRSQGTSVGFLEAQEVDDYVRAIEWAAAQPWCNGDVCLFGTSYYGMIQPLIAARQPKALRAMFANEVCTDFFRHLVAYGGSVNNRFFALWMGANFKDEDFSHTLAPWQRAAASQVIQRPWLWDRFVHPRIDSIYDGFMTKRPSKSMRQMWVEMVTGSKTRADMRAAGMDEGVFRSLDTITTPFVVVHNPGMWNLHQFGAFDLFERAGTPDDQKYLIVGPAEYELPVLSWQLEALAFFDHVVKGCDNGYDQQPRVRSFLEGEGRFEGATRYPIPAATRTRLHLTADDGLSEAAPAGGEATWSAIPLSTPMPDGIDEVLEQRVEFRKRVDAPCKIVGPVSVNLRFSCNEIDSFVVAALSRVDRDGVRHVLSVGAIRPARRTVDPALSSASEIVIDTEPLVPLVPGTPVALRFSLTPASSSFAAGDTLLLQIASRCDQVKGRLGDGYIHMDLEAPPYFSRNTIHLGAESWLEVEQVS